MSVKTPFSSVIALSLLVASAPACGNAENGSLDPQGDVAGPVDEEVGESRAAAMLPWVSGLNCPYGLFGCNKCVPDVPAAFDRASGSRSRRHRFFFDPNTYSENEDMPDAFHARDHIQSITRIPGLGDENFVALSRNARDKGDGAFYITSFSQISSHGDAWKWAFRRTTSNPTAKQHGYYRMPGSNHAGGMQAVGPMLFTASDCDEGQSCTAAVHIWDVRSPAFATIISSIVLDGSQGELDVPPATTPWPPPGRVSSRAAAVGAVRLKDGRMLVFIRGRESDYSGWFYVSDSVGIGPETHWTFVDHWTVDDLKVEPPPPNSPFPTERRDPWHSWESINLLSDCNDGQLYAVMMGTMSNKSFLYRITSSDLGGRENLFLHNVSGRGLNTTGPSTTTRAGAGVHVTPNGNLVSYVTDRKPEVEIEEFRYHGAHGD